MWVVLWVVVGLASRVQALVDQPDALGQVALGRDDAERGAGGHQEAGTAQRAGNHADVGLRAVVGVAIAGERRR